MRMSDVSLIIQGIEIVRFSGRGVDHVGENTIR